DPCVANSVEEVFPADGSRNAYYRTTVEARLDDPDPTATIDLSDVRGPVPGSVQVAEDIIVFTPNAPLDPDTAHAVTITYGQVCTVDTTFTTSSVGGSTNVSNLVGRVYDLDLQSGRFVSPEGIGSLIGKFLADAQLFLAVQAASPTQIDLLLAPGAPLSPGQQDHCLATTTFPAGDFRDNPFFEVVASGQSVEVTVDGVAIAIDDLLLSGAFEQDGSSISGAVMAGLIDTRPLVDLVEQGGAEDAICELAGSIGVDCIRCPDGAELCMDLYIDNLTLLQATSTTVVPVAPGDICTQFASECPAECSAR
ncbi:MAG: hypothetical protein KC912_26445, partial [Proteobacteria bacterium]|nr:hypothetical protein [Pseudomonadota bacterium]